MGYVRMIRSGGLLYTGNAIKFVPNLEEIAKFGEFLQQQVGAAVPPETLTAAECVPTIPYQ
jgi:hypothetical protein